MIIPEDLQYTEDHEWVKIENEIATIGITDYAQGELGDIIFIELPQPGDAVEEKASIGTIEAVKTVADIYSPMQGEIYEVNPILEDEPECVNTDPYAKGWIIKLTNFTNDTANFLTADEYKILVQ